ncbi:hypothetical protein [Scytonema sp. PRP1]|uniref:hypothetical protein n=1 Tax=Scytonema sp. PRP1 TaxID=3120513 RepID=UPI002FD71D32
MSVLRFGVSLNGRLCAIALLEILGTQLIGHLAIVIYPVCGDKDVQTVAKFLNPK